MIMIIYLVVSHVTDPMSTPFRIPIVPPLMSQCHRSSTHTHPFAGHSHRAAASCQCCFLLLCSETSAEACSFRGFLLSGSSRAEPCLGHTARSQSANTLGSCLFCVVSWGLSWPPLNILKLSKCLVLGWSHEMGTRYHISTIDRVPSPVLPSETPDRLQQT